MRGRTLALALTLVVLTPMLLTVSALADLRSSEGTAALGARLADEPVVQEVIVAAVVSALLDDASDRSPAFAVFATLLRPRLTDAASAALASPAGRAAIASSITDALRQLSVRGPIVIDLREAALVAARTAPEPLDSLALLAVEQGTLGRIVVARDADGAALRSPDGHVDRVGGLPAGPATALTALLLVLTVAGLVMPGRAGDGTSRTRRLTAGGVLLAGGAVGLLVLLGMPRAIVTLATTTTDGAGASSTLDAALPVLVDGLAGLLGRTVAIAAAIAASGLLLVAVGARTGRLSAAGSPPGEDRPPRG